MKNRTSMQIVVAGAIVALALVVLGAVQGPAFAAVTADTTPPSVVLTAPIAGAAIRNGQALSAGASDAGGIASVAFRYCAGTTCPWTSGKPIGTATAAPYTISWSAQPADGPYTLLARATDKAGNVTTTGATAITVDNTPPATTILTRPPLVTAMASATFTFSSEARATFLCSLDGAAFGTCASPKSYTGLAAGWHSFRARAVDRAGNVDPNPPTAYWYANLPTDTTPPETTITAQPAALTSATGATFSFSSEAGATLACSLDGAAYSTCTSPKSYSGLIDGAHTFAVRATDAAGNTDPTPASASWTVDTVAPDTAIGAHPASPTNAAAATFTFVSEAGAKFACSLDGAAYSTCASPKSYSGLADGIHTFSVRAADAAANTDASPASVTWTIDTAAPDTAIAAHPATLTNSTRGTFTFSSEAGATFTCSLDGASYGTCASPTDLSSLKDGSHTFAVRATDAAGNTDATPSSYTWTVDTSAPDTAIAAHPATLTNSTRGTFTFSSEAGATFTCSLDGASYGTCASPTDLSSLKDGSHTFAVRATDAAGNADATPASYTWTVDTTAPETALDTTPAKLTRETNASFAFSSETGATLACSVDGADYTSCTSPLDLSGLKDGSLTFAVRATDAAGNTDATPSTYTWTVDTTAPETTLDTTPAKLTRETNASFAFSSETGATLACSLDGADYTGCNSPTDLSSLKDGSHTFAVRATDAAGNTDATPASYTWTVDTTAPETAIDATPSALTMETSAIFAFSTEAGATLACSLDGAIYSTCTAPTDLSGLEDGSHTFAVRATDAAGNTDSSPATFTWTVDTAAPDTTIDATPSTLTLETSATFAFSTEAGATFACSLDNGDYTSCTPPTHLSDLKDGSHTFAVRATDAAGNTDGSPATFTWTVDTTAPDTTLDAHPPLLTNDRRASFAFSSVAGTSFACSVDGGDYGSCDSPKELSGLKDGGHTFAVHATDAAGNTDGSPATFAWTVDTTAPDVQFTEHPTRLTRETRAHFDFSSETGATFECSLDGERFYDCQPPENVAAPIEGDHTFAVRATDAAGNTGSDPATFSWTVDTVAPNVALDEHPPAATNSKDAHFVFSSEAHATFECSVDNAPFSACTAPIDLSNLADGDHTLSVRATDETGNTGDAATSHWTVDTVTPDTTIGSRPDSPATATDATFTFSSNEDATFECQLDDGAFERCTSPDLLGGLADGSHTLSVRAVDAAGNTDSSPDSYTWTVDAAPPAASITSPEANASVSGLVSFVAEVSDQNGIGGVQFKVDGVNVGPEDHGPAPYRVSWDTTSASNGPHTLSLDARDTAGNVATTSIEVKVSNDPAATATPGLIAVGPGYVDATARQVVRTAEDRAYIIAVDDSAFQTGTGSAVIRAWKADTTGSPTGFAEADATNHPRPGASGINNIVGVDLRLDRESGIVHTIRLESGGGGSLVYQTFDTHTDRWSSTDEDVASGMPAAGRGRGTFALAVDAAGNPHVAYVKDGTLYYVERAAGSWSSPVALGTGVALLHPSMSFDAAGNLHVAWLDDDTTAPAVEYRELRAGGSWDATETVATGDVLTNSNADQGVSVAANTAGVPYVLYLSGPRGRFGSSNAVFGAVQIKYRSADGSWHSDNPAPELLAHTPQLYLHGDDVYAFLGHDIDGHLAYAVHQPGHPWSATTLLSGDGDGFLDGAASVRFDVPDQNPGVIDSVFYNEDKLHDKSDLPQLYYRALTPAAPYEPAPPDTTAPSVSIDAPAADATVTGAVSVSAQATDDVGVTSVQFKLDGAGLGAADATAPYSVTWDSLTALNGPHELTAIARDAVGHETTSSAVTVTVQNSAPPSALVTLLGSEGVGANADYNDEGVAEAFQVSADASGSLSSLQVYLASDSAATSVIAGVYSDDGSDRPGQLLTQATISLPVADAWNTVTVPSVPIEFGTKYWIALLAPSGAGQVTFRDADSGGLAVVDSAAGTELPSTWTTTGGPWSNAPLSAFGTT